MIITYKIKRFKELEVSELYELLRLRSQVFVVEQNCVYQDLDNKDQSGLHILGYKDQELIAYTRIFDKNQYFEQASIGRVVILESERSSGCGKELMQVSIKALEDEYGKQTIKISAQSHLEFFYNQLGFISINKEYLEDGIPHIAMIKN